MPDREKVIEGVSRCIDTHKSCSMDCPYWNSDCSRELMRDVLALLKAQEATVEPKRIELADKTKSWLDKMDAVDALGNIADICIDWDGYRTANGLGGLINEIWAYARYCADRLQKAQAVNSVCTKERCPMNASTISDDCNIETCPWRTEALIPRPSMSGLWYECPACGRHLTEDLDNYCAHCGRRVKWDG